MVTAVKLNWVGIFRSSAGCPRRLQPKANQSVARFFIPLVMAVALGEMSRAVTHADEPPVPASHDKSEYHLFNPTPRALMRDMDTDRPDKTESPYTVDAGHFQIEMDVFNYTYDHYNAEHRDVSAESLWIAPMNLKAGLFNNVDLQLVLGTYNSVRIHDRDAGTVEKQRGFGDMLTRLKINFWGNDGGPTAFGVLPYVKFPTSQDHLGNSSVEGGVIFPLAVELPHGFGMGVMTQFDFTRDEAEGGHHPEFVNSVTFSHNLGGELEGYVEFFSVASAESNSPWIGTFDVGFTYGLTKDIQLDAGVNLGVTRSADDVNTFMGISWRF